MAHLLHTPQVSNASQMASHAINRHSAALCAVMVHFLARRPKRYASRRRGCRVRRRALGVTGVAICSTDDGRRDMVGHLDDCTGISKGGIGTVVAAVAPRSGKQRMHQIPAGEGHRTGQGMAAARIAGVSPDRNVICGHTFSGTARPVAGRACALAGIG